MKILLLMVVLAAVAGGLWRYTDLAAPSASASEPRAESLYSVRRGTLDITVSENGYLKAKNDVKIKPEFQREATITWLVDEGREVVEGDLLCEFDKSELDTQIDELQTTLIQFRNELEAAQAELEIQRRDNLADVERAEFELEVAKLTLERYTRGEAPNERRKMQLAAEKAESDYTRAKERFEQAPLLHEQGFLTKSAVEEERIRVREAEINQENAFEDLRLFDTYTHPMELRQRENAVRDAERTLTNAQEKATINLKEKQARVSRSEAQVKSTETRLTKLEEEFAQMTIRAPQAGIVHYGDPARPWYREEIRVGNRVRRGNTIVTLPDLSVMQVLVQIHEADIDLVRIGQEVLVTVESAKSRVFPARVTQIDSVASENWMDEANKTFGAEVTLEPTDLEMRSGITALAAIQVEKLENVAYVPIHAVISEGANHYCFLPKEGAFEQRRVVIGKNNQHYVEVSEGLAVGEKILLYDPRAGEPTEAAEEEEEEAEPAGLAPSMASAAE